MLGAACGAGMCGVVDWADSRCDVGPWFVCGLGCSLCPESGALPERRQTGANQRDDSVVHVHATRTRIGIPLVIAKASTTHASQGITVGPTEPMQHLLFDVGKRTGAAIHPEDRWPNIIYVACSRPTHMRCLALAQEFCEDDARRICKGKKWQNQDAEVQRVTALADQQFDQAGGEQRSAEHFKTALAHFIEHVTELHTHQGVYNGTAESTAVLQCMRQWTQSLERLQ